MLLTSAQPPELIYQYRSKLMSNIHQNDRYKTFRKWAITSVDDIVEGQVYYEAYCLGKSSFVYEMVINSACIKKCEIINQDFIIIDNQHAYLNDLGLGDSNNNQHLIFNTKHKAEEYVQACRNDPDECNRHSLLQADLDILDNILDDRFDNYFYEREDKES
jgi:hypothetical protein